MNQCHVFFCEPKNIANFYKVIKKKQKQMMTMLSPPLLYYSPTSQRTRFQLTTGQEQNQQQQQNQNQNQRHSSSSSSNTIQRNEINFFHQCRQSAADTTSTTTTKTTTTTAMTLLTATNRSALATAAVACDICTILHAMNQYVYTVTLQERCSQGIATILITLVKLQLQQRREELELESDYLNSSLSSAHHCWSIFRCSKQSIIKSHNHSNHKNGNRRWSSSLGSINDSNSFDDRRHGMVDQSSRSLFLSTGSNGKSTNRVSDNPLWRKRSSVTSLLLSRKENDCNKIVPYHSHSTSNNKDDKNNN